MTDEESKFVGPMITAHVGLCFIFDPRPLPCTIMLIVDVIACELGSAISRVLYPTPEPVGHLHQMSIRNTVVGEIRPIESVEDL